MLSSDIVHIHGLNANVTEEKVSRHIMAEDLRGMMVTVAYLRALHLDARELGGKRPKLFHKGRIHTTPPGFATQQRPCDIRIIYSGFN